MKYLHVRLVEEQATFLDDYSKSKGLNKSDVTRNLIARLEQLTSDELKDEIIEFDKNRKSEQLNLFLTEEEIRTLEANARAHGFSRTQYVYSVLRQELLGASLIPQEELSAISEHIALIRQIGTNINQIARKLHQANKEDVRVEELDKLYNLIVHETAFLRDKLHKATSRHSED